MRNLRRIIRKLILENDLPDNYSKKNPLGNRLFQGGSYMVDMDPEEERATRESMTQEEEIFLAKGIGHIENNDSGECSSELIEKMISYLNQPIYSKALKYNPANAKYVYRGMTVDKRWCERMFDMNDDGPTRDWDHQDIWTYDEFVQMPDNPYGETGYPCDFSFDEDVQEDIYGSRKSISSWTQKFERAMFFANRTFDRTNRFSKGDSRKQSIILVAPLQNGWNENYLMNMAEFGEYSDVAGAYKKEEEWLALGGIDVIGWIPVNNGWNEG